MSPFGYLAGASIVLIILWLVIWAIGVIVVGYLLGVGLWFAAPRELKHLLKALCHELPPPYTLQTLAGAMMRYYARTDAEAQRQANTQPSRTV